MAPWLQFTLINQITEQKEEFMSTKLFPIIAATVTVLVFSAQAYAAEAGQNVLPKQRPVEKSSELRPHIGLIAGAAQPEGSGISSGEYGLSVGYQPYIPFGAGVEYTHARIDDGFESKNRDTVILKGTYNFGGTTPVIKDSYLGLGLGTVLKSDGTSLVVAPLAGFDIPLKHDEAQFVSIGAATRYAIVNDGEADTFSLSGVVKYWY